MADLIATTPLAAARGVALDTETTGLNIKSDRIIEVAAVAFDGADIDGDGAYQSLVAAGVPIPAASSKVHGILDGDLAGAPPFAAVYGDLMRWIDGQLVIGHTVGFDMGILAAECERHKLAWKAPHFLDIRVLAQIAAPSLPGYSLEALAAWLNVDLGERHRALGDSVSSARVFQALVPKLRDVGIRTVGEAATACRRQQEGLEQTRALAFAAASDPLPAGAALARIDAYPYRHRVRDVMSKPPVAVPASTPLSDVLDLMTSKRISAVLVGEPDMSAAIFTERDLLRAIARYGAGVLSREAGDFGVAPLISVPEDAFVYRAVGRMSRHNIRHLAASSGDGRISGIVSIRDLLRLRASTAIELGDDIDAAETVAALGRAWAKLPAMARSLLAEGIEARDIAAIIARELGALTRRAAILGERRMKNLSNGAPPCGYALLVLGSAGRGESLLAMDQDNALVFAEGAPEGANDQWFAELGKHVADILHEVGVPYCPGGVMASRPAFRGSAEEWRRRFAHWVSRSNPEDLLSADITYDFRAVHGDLALAADLRSAAWAEARHATPFHKLLAANGAGGDSAFTLFGGFRTDEQGRIDLKNAGLRKIVTAARVLALRHGVVRHSTQDRVAGLLALDIGGDADFKAMDRAHCVVLDAILRQQLADIAAGKPPSNRVDPKILGKDGAKQLKEALSGLSALDDMVRSQLTGT